MANDLMRRFPQPTREPGGFILATLCYVAFI